MYLRIVMTLIFFALFLTSIHLMRHFKPKKKEDEPVSVSKTYKISVVFSSAIFGFMFFSNMLVLLKIFLPRALKRLSEPRASLICIVVLISVLVYAIVFDGVYLPGVRARIFFGGKSLPMLFTYFLLAIIPQGLGIANRAASSNRIFHHPNVI